MFRGEGEERERRERGKKGRRGGEEKTHIRLTPMSMLLNLLNLFYTFLRFFVVVEFVFGFDVGCALMPPIPSNIHCSLARGKGEGRKGNAPDVNEEEPSP